MPGPGPGPGPRPGGGRPGPGGPGMRPEPMDMGALKKAFAYFKEYLPLIILSVVFAAGSSAGSIIGPDFISDITDTIVSGIAAGVDMRAFTATASKLIAVYCVCAVFGYLQSVLSSRVTHKTSQQLRSDLNSKLERLPLNYFDSTTRGDILSVVTNDVDTISSTLSSTASSLISGAAMLIGIIFMMFRSSVVLTLVTIGTSLIGFAFMSVIPRKSQRYFDQRQRQLGQMNGQIEDVFTNNRIVCAFGGKDFEKKKFDSINDELYVSSFKSQNIATMMMPVMDFVGNLAYVLLFVVGVSLITGRSSAVSFGTIMAFVMYSKLFGQPLGTFARSLSSLQQASASAKRVFGILDQPEMEDESGKVKTIDGVKGSVTFDHVRFGYSPDRTIIHDFSARLEPGQKVAIVGPTGAGKTTMVNLLMRFYDVDSGRILIDGIDTGEVPRENIRDQFDMILQDTWLFEGTIRENLVFNKENVTEEQLDKAVEAVGLSHFISTLPEGYDTPLSDSLNLSEGQKQQLTIARAIIKDSPLLILDEATSSVDTRTEVIIQKAMDELTQGRTSFIIAHRLSTIRDADVILVMRDGDIVEHGSHAELMAQNGFYAELYNSQFVVT